jgi:hypothetical protein
MPDGSNMILGAVNTATTTTRLNQIGTAATDLFLVTNAGSGRHAIVGRGGSEDRSDAAVWGDGSSYSSGVVGTATYGEGVRGEALNAGVHGISSSSAGVVGEAQTYAGVEGHSQAPLGTGGGPGQTRFGEGAGVRGIGGNTGVEGFTGGGAGVWGRSISGVGVRGVSESDVGVFGTSQSYAGVVAVSESRWFGAFAQAWNGTGVVAVGRRGLYAEGRPAGQFVGDVVVDGNLIVTGWKAAAIEQPDGSRRILHALECPEAAFEDFGRARLRKGRAKVALDPMFASAVETDGYHVFVTPEGECAGLYVARRTRRGFEVREQGGRRSSAGFSYRVVARRLDVPAPRFRRTALPPPLAIPARELPSRLPRKARRAAVPVADLGPLMARAWAQTRSAPRSPRVARPRRSRKRGSSD